MKKKIGKMRFAVQDWDPILKQLDPKEGPLTFLLNQMKFQSAGKLTGHLEDEPSVRLGGTE